MIWKALTGALAVVVWVGTAAGAPARWTVTDEDTTLLVFGSVHMMQPGTDWLDSGLRADLMRADRLYLESVQDASATADMQMFVAREGLMRGTTLKERLGPDVFGRVAVQFESVGIPRAQIMTMRPWLATLSLVFGKFRELGFDPALGVDQTMERLAGSANIPVIGLESPLEGVRLFTQLPPDLEDKMLIETVEQLDDLEVYVTNLTNAWLSGDIETVATLSNQSIAESPALMEPLLIGRNRAWAETIGTVMADPGFFVIVVGSAHLSGDDNMLSMLRDRGLTVTRAPQ